MKPEFLGVTTKLTLRRASKTHWDWLYIEMTNT